MANSGSGGAGSGTIRPPIAGAAGNNHSYSGPQSAQRPPPPPPAAAAAAVSVADFAEYDPITGQPISTAAPAPAPAYTPTPTLGTFLHGRICWIIMLCPFRM